PLSLGAMLYTGYTWFYDATGTPVTLTGYPSGIPRQVQVDPQFDHQPTQQSYGGEIYVGYNLPSIAVRQRDVDVPFDAGERRQVVADVDLAAVRLLRWLVNG